MCIRHICNYISNSCSFVNICCDSMIFREKERKRERKERERESYHIPEVGAQDFKTSYNFQGHGSVFLFLKWIPCLMLLMNWENHITLLEGYGIWWLDQDRQLVQPRTWPHNRIHYSSLICATIGYGSLSKKFIQHLDRRNPGPGKYGELVN